MPRVLVKVVGFSTVERHALNTLFRLSDERETAYSLWVPGTAEAPQLFLLDSGSPDAQAELKTAGAAGAKVIWVGPGAPAGSAGVFTRPMAWHDVIQAMDRLFAPAPAPATAPAQGAAPSDFDLDLGGDDSAADTLPPEPEPPQKRALIISADRDQRLYLRARLALAGMTAVDEAQNGAEALEMARMLPYCLALVDHHPVAVEGWPLVKALHANKAKPYVVLAKEDANLVDRWRAWMFGADTLLDKPIEPGALQVVLDRVAARNHPAPVADLVVQ